MIYLPGGGFRQSPFPSLEADPPLGRPPLGRRPTLVRPSRQTCRAHRYSHQMAATATAVRILLECIPAYYIIIDTLNTSMFFDCLFFSSPKLFESGLSRRYATKSVKVLWCVDFHGGV